MKKLKKSKPQTLQKHSNPYMSLATPPMKYWQYIGMMPKQRYTVTPAVKNGDVVNIGDGDGKKVLIFEEYEEEER